MEAQGARAARGRDAGAVGGAARRRRTVVRVVLVAGAVATNPLGRLHSNWLAARAVGLEVRTLVADLDAEVWRPVRDDHQFRASFVADGLAAARWADVLVAHKPQPASYGRARALRRRTGVPLILDVDDPDFEAKFGETGAERRRNAARALRRGRPGRVRALVRLGKLRGHASREPFLTVSNPAIHHWYERGTILPHARRVTGVTEPPSAGGPLRLAFVGTVRDHKGIEDLRMAAARVGGIELTVTADAPSDARPHERWVGHTDLATGRALVAGSHVIAVVSGDTVYGRGQLPAKLVDAMLAGRAVVGADLPPIRWALGGAGILLRPDDPVGLGDALAHLRDDHDLRLDLGRRARRRAEALFSDEAVGRTLLAECEKAVASAAGGAR